MRLDSIVPVDAPEDHGRFEGRIPLGASGWCIVRASSDSARYFRAWIAQMERNAAATHTAVH